MQGHSLILEICRLSGLPQDWAEQRLSRLLESSGASASTASLSEIREILGVLLQEALLEAKDSLQSDGKSVG